MSLTSEKEEFYLFYLTFRQHLQKVLSGHPGQVDFPPGEVTFHSHLFDVQRITQALCKLNHLRRKLGIAHD